MSRKVVSSSVSVRLNVERLESGGNIGHRRPLRLASLAKITLAPTDQAKAPIINGRYGSIYSPALNNAACLMMSALGRKQKIEDLRRH
jgi:hypothetical protein